MSSTLPMSVSELEPVSDFPGGSEWFSSARTSAILRTGPHTAALQASRWATSWCDACGRRRGADGRCAICDPWWTSPFYVYGSLLTLGVTALLMIVMPLLRPASFDARPTTGASNAAILQQSALGTNRPIAYSAPLPMLPMYPYRSVPPAFPVLPRPIVVPPAVAPGANDNTAAMADLAKLRAMTDFAAGAETRRAAVRAFSPVPPPVVYQPRVNVAPVLTPEAPAQATMPPAVAPSIAAPTAADPIDSAARSADAAQTL